MSFSADRRKRRLFPNFEIGMGLLDRGFDDTRYEPVTGDGLSSILHPKEF